MNIRVGIIGNGVVGGATAAAFRDHVDEVRCWDGISERCTHDLHDTVCGADLVFVCLPTPQKQDSLACDISTIDMFFRHMRDLKQCNTNFVLRSTVPVGTTRALREKYGLVNLVHSPEFLTARTAEHDAANPARLLIGDPTFHEEPRAYYATGCLTQLLRLHRTVWPHMRTYCMTSDESEFVKLMQNTFSAIKIAAFNEFRQFSDKKELDWERCLAALLAGGWINSAHTQVPGPDGKRGYGGTCLPKDINNLITCGLEANVPMLVSSAAALRNEQYDRKS